MNVARRLDELLQARYITRGKSLRSFARGISPWSYAALQGRLVSLLPGAMNAPFTALFQVIWDAQEEGETVAWVGGTQSCFYPPDVARLGVDLNAITVIRLSADKDIWFAADTLIRSGAVGMVVIDLASLEERRPSKNSLALQHRLSGLARTHNCAVIILPFHQNRHDDNGVLVSLTVKTSKTPLSLPFGAYQLGVTPQKDKTGTSNWKIEEVCDAPDGLC
ncbi:MAG: hypothetical protein JXR76_15900 [Deltaproteobacteria bacterium]|nr:hypothetical protein [Deltaproteobacteria bacterium]